MLQITGKVINLFTVEGGKDKEGKEFAEKHKVQLMGNVALGVPLNSDNSVKVSKTSSDKVRLTRFLCFCI